jgi:hypothetical protein
MNEPQLNTEKVEVSQIGSIIILYVPGGKVNYLL